MGNNRNHNVSRREFLTRSAVFGAGTLTGQLLGCTESCSSEPSHKPAHDSKPRNGGSRPKQEPNTRPKRPNIVYLYSDQHRGDALGTTGHPIVKTPHLDKLAQQGVTFGRCYSAGPLCRPGRASMMTGLYPHDHRVWHNFVVAPAYSPSHVRQIRDQARYLTAVIGKTHLHKGENHLDTYKGILDVWGFEYAKELIGPGQTAHIENAYTDWLSATTPKGEEDKYQRFKKYIDHYLKNHFYTPWNVQPPDDAPWRLSTLDHLDRYTGQTAAKWIGDYSDERPFYLQVNFPGPHDPFDATNEYLSMYNLEDPKMPNGIRKCPKEPLSTPTKISRDFQNVTGITHEQRRRLQMAYYSKVTLVDEAVGDVMAALEKRGLLENTWIIYGSDHGEMLGDHCLVQKGVFYEPSIHIPCIMRPPGGLGGWKSNGLVGQLDVTASILEMAGLRSPFGPKHGVSLLGKIEGGPDKPDADKGREWVLSENYRHGMVRNDRYKVVANYQTASAVELYDLEADPNELKNLVFDPSHAKILKQAADLMREIVPKKVWGSELRS